MSTHQERSECTRRRVRLQFPDLVPAVWTTRVPEASIAANGVSMQMPHVEPFVVRAAGTAIDRLAASGDLDELTEARARDFMAQERQHLREHQRFNRALIESAPGLRRVDRWAHRSWRWLGRRCSDDSALALACGTETIAYALARWTDRHVGLFDDADPAIATLFFWHLGEEVEHKSVVFDLYRRLDGSRLRQMAAGAVSVALLSWFTILSAWILLGASGRRFSPVAWARLTRYGISLAFEVLPDLLASTMVSHHPSDFVDPTFLTTWLRCYEPDAVVPDADSCWSTPPQRRYDRGSEQARRLRI